MDKKVRYTVVLLFMAIAVFCLAFAEDYKYVGSVNSDVYHYLSNCEGAAKIKEKNRVFFVSVAEAVADGRHPCAICHPPRTDGASPTASQTLPTSAPSHISVSINGTVIPVEPAPFVEGGRTYVPVRSVLEAYGVDALSWEPPYVKVTLGDTVLQIPVGNRSIIKNGTAFNTDAAAMIKDGRTCLPIRSVIEALGGTVGWDADTKTVLITKP